MCLLEGQTEKKIPHTDLSSWFGFVEDILPLATRPWKVSQQCGFCFIQSVPAGE